ncbi:MAG: phasin family protein [Hyphomicrobiaceae bacterium]
MFTPNTDRGLPSVDRGLAVMDDATRAFQAMTAEFNDFSQRLLADGTATFSQMTAAKTVPEYVELMSAFTKRAMEESMQQMLRMGNMYASAANDQTRAMQALMLAGQR